MGIECTECGNEYKRIGCHWAKSACGYPEISDTQKEIILGLLMGDASVEDRGSSGRLSTQMVNWEFLNWVSDKLGILACDIKNYYSGSEQKERIIDEGSLGASDEHDFSDVYDLKTRSHPYFKELYSWYGENGKRFPESLTLTATIAKVWYCCDGSLIGGGQRPHVRFYTKNERDRLSLLKQYFIECGFDAREYEGAIGFSSDESERLLSWMGEPPDGMEYKWNLSIHDT